MSAQRIPQAPTDGSRLSTRRRPGEPSRWLSILTAVLLLAYGTVRIILLTIDDPIPMSVPGPDLVVFDGLAAIGIIAIALAAIGAQLWILRHRPTRIPRLLVAAAGALSSAALMSAGALILLDLVGAVLSGLGVVFFPLGALSRLGCVTAAALVAAHTWQFWTATRPAGTDRSTDRSVLTETPGWLLAIGYLTVAACLTRLIAQLVVGKGLIPFDAGPSLFVFEAGFLLAGILLPLALVHRWGRIWPQWVPGLRGRRVPRMLLVGSGTVLGVGMSAYFGMMTAKMVVDRINGLNPFPPSGGLDLPEAFFWVSVPAYLVWGLGLVIATVNYARLTRR